MIEKKKQLKQEQKTVLVGIITGGQTEQQLNDYLDELAFLAETAGVITVKRFTQKLPHPDSRTFVGKGKLEEIKRFVSLQSDVELVIFDDELTGSQIQNIEKELGVKTIDRSDLILDIFASRAKTAQARTQVGVRACAGPARGFRRCLSRPDSALAASAIVSGPGRPAAESAS